MSKSRYMHIHLSSIDTSLIYDIPISSIPHNFPSAIHPFGQTYVVVPIDAVLHVNSQRVVIAEVRAVLKQCVL
jgi:hypothetical protein